MSILSNHINELRVSEAFTRQSAVFDGIYGSDEIVQYKRERVREHMEKLLSPMASILELNCGSGEDALYFAHKGFTVHATDISPGMLQVLKQKIGEEGGKTQLSTGICSFTELDTLKNRGPYDHIFSNLGGLNCTGQLNRVLGSLDPLLKPGGSLTLVIISKFCLWELLLLFRGKFRTAFRRFFSRRGRQARVEGRQFQCWYYSPAQIRKGLEDNFDFLSCEGLCALVPPSYIQGFAHKYPRLFSFLRSRENQWKSRWPWKYMGDYFIISFRKRSVGGRTDTGSISW